MAVAVAELVQYTTTDNGTSYESSSYTPTASRGLLACIFASATDHNLTPTVTGNGATWELIDRASRGAHAMWIFASYSGTSPTETGLSVEINGADPATGIIIWVGEMSGVDATPTLFLTQYAHGAFDADESPVVAYDATTDAGCAAVGFLGCLLNPAAQTPPTGWTEAMDTGITNPTAGATVAFHDGPGAIADVTWGSTPTTVSTLMIVEIAAAAAGSDTATPTTVAAVAAIPTPTTLPTTLPSLSTVAATASVSTPTVSGAGSLAPAVTKKVRRFTRFGFVYEGHVLRTKDAPRQ